MATTTLTPAQKAARSTVALKALMAVSGLIMIGYLLAHMYGNLKVFAGQASFDGYAHHLRTLGEPILPHTGLLWIIRVVLLAAVIAHAYSAFVLWSRASTARGGGSAKRYQTSKNQRGVQRSYASFTLRWGGIIILLFVIYHLLHFTWNTIHPGGASDSPYQRVVNGFSDLVGRAVLHRGHDRGRLPPAARHVERPDHPRRQHLGAGPAPAQPLAYAVAGIVTIGFLLPPFAILFGLVK